MRAPSSLSLGASSRPCAPAPLARRGGMRAALQSRSRSVQVACRNSGSGQRRHPEADDGTSSSSIPDSLPVLGVDSDWRDFRAQLVARSRAAAAAQDSEEQAEASTSGRSSPSPSSTLWAHSLPQPEKGCVLLAHPQLFSSSQEYFYQALILILDHNETGSFGVILNRPSMYTLSELSLTHPLPEFNDCTLYVGGDVGGGDITLLHSQPGLKGSVEVVKGVYVGGILAAQEAVQEGRASANDFRFFAKYAGWGPGQLESECRRGVWFTAAASPSAVLEPPTAKDGSDRWHQVLELMGGDYARLSGNVRASHERQQLRRAAAGAAGSSGSSAWEGAAEEPQVEQREEGRREAEGGEGKAADGTQ